MSVYSGLALEGTLSAMIYVAEAEVPLEELVRPESSCMVSTINRSPEGMDG